MWEAFWPLKGMKMQPTKKMSIRKLILAAVGSASFAIHPTADAAEYRLGPDTVAGTPVAATITATVANKLRPTNISFTEYPASVSPRATTLGKLYITAQGAGVAPAGYMIEPCTNAAGYELTINGTRIEDLGLN